MDFNDYQLHTPSKVDFSGYSRGKNEIPWGFMFFYLFLSVILCYLYHKKIVAPADWNAPNSINAVASFETSKPYQFRLLLPMIIKYLGLAPIYNIYGKYFYSAYNVVIVLITIVVFYKMLASKYFASKRLLWLAPIILYPMLWNYVILNQSFQYYDFTAILFFTAGLYFIVNENFMKLLILFIFAIINKETAGYLVFAYLFYNYKEIWTKRVIVNTVILAAVFIGWKILLSNIFMLNPGDNFEIGFAENKRIISELFTNKTLLKNFLLNFGGLYVFVILLFVTGAWKKFPNRRLIFVNLVIVPYYIFGIYITYITEVRVYTELIPMITALFLIYLSNFKRLNLNPYQPAEKGT